MSFQIDWRPRQESIWRPFIDRERERERLSAGPSSAEPESTAGENRRVNEARPVDRHRDRLAGRLRKSSPNRQKKEKTKEHEDSIFFFKKRPLTYSEWKLSSAEALKRVKPTMEAIVCWRSISGAANRRNPVKLGKSAENPVKLGRRMANSVQPSERGQRRAARRRRCVCFIRRRRRRRRFHFPRRFITEFRTGFWERRRRRRSMAATTRVATHRPRLSLKKKKQIYFQKFSLPPHTPSHAGASR